MRRHLCCGLLYSVGILCHLPMSYAYQHHHVSIGVAEVAAVVNITDATEVTTATHVIDYRADTMAWHAFWALPAQISVKQVAHATQTKGNVLSDVADCQLWLVGWSADGDVLAALPMSTLPMATVAMTTAAMTTGSMITVPESMSARSQGGMIPGAQTRSDTVFNDKGPVSPIANNAVSNAPVATAKTAADPLHRYTSAEVLATTLATTNDVNELQRLMAQQVRQWQFVPRQTPARPALAWLWLTVDAAKRRLQLCVHR